MQQPDAAEIARCRAVVVSTLPQFARGNFEVLPAGWDSTALLCDGWVFKFPRSAAAEERLRREVAILDYLRPRLTMTLPRLVLHEGRQPFTQHALIPGEHLVTEIYEQLDAGRRDALALRLAQFYAELHALPLARLQAIGAIGTAPSMAPDDILAGALPLLPKRLAPFVKRTVKAYSKLSISGDELVFGYFDGHGWNMAFDLSTGLLNGLYDFADSGFGARHRDLSFTNFISADLTLRVIAHYEPLARHAVDRQLVMLYTSVLRLVELVEGELDHATALEAVRSWERTLAAFKASGALVAGG